MTKIPKSSLNFLKRLKENNNREWMQAHKKEYQSNEKILKTVYSEIKDGLNIFDEIEKIKVFRINRDIRFSKNKAPYNAHRSAIFSRLGAHRRGSYYLRIEPNGKSEIGGGFYGPEPADLKRIRMEFQMDSAEIREIISRPAFKEIFGDFVLWNPVKTAPRGFDKEDPNIDLIRLKNFVFTKRFTDKEVLSENFAEKVIGYYSLLIPYFKYMSEVLTTDMNGQSLLDR